MDSLIDCPYYLAADVSSLLPYLISWNTEAKIEVSRRRWFFTKFPSFVFIFVRAHILAAADSLL